MRPLEADSDAPVEIARAESERGELVLRRRRDADGPVVLELRANGVFVMDTREVGTEQALATEALRLVAAPSRVLVAGLGLGFTLREVLADARVEEVAVVEVEPALVGWMRDGTVPHGPVALADKRVRVIEADIAVALAEAGDARFDLVLLDVDNGPGHLVHDENATLYHEPFLHTVRRVLRPGGAIVVWSSAASPDLQDSLSGVFGNASGVPLAVQLQGREVTYWLYAGSR
ncbi:spermine/spermidine synthase domain-containing protein [Nocardioides acrostichi]|uniref:Methyltransferase domain-containing protein n=1 Tax=Nocardioides acrostichi TaxID=2784339 RepID=A0A930V5J7_9ACTN|nr:methyltransferase domain-containing protein [Nocardioides acrostichi]MBF4163579.1 methyltransferase domain-containing protein [Nocardioides acrostichi]